jgi:DNA-binding NtrC family response regulator
MNEKPRDPDVMDRLACLQAELDETRRQLALAQRLQRRPEHRIIDFVGTSALAQEVKRQARRVAQADAPVLLMGEVGTGKSLLAHAIHAASRRAAQPMVTVRVSAVPTAMLDQELFGPVPTVSRRGEEPHPGRLRLADGGTLFLDEIGDLPLALQAKLLHVLRSQELPESPGWSAQSVNVRLIASTRRDLAAMVQRGLFRADLYYGLHVLPLRVPPLRERIDDIEALVEVLMEDLARRGGLPPKSLGASALAALQRRRWPGNVRELRDLLEQAFLAGSSPVLTAADLVPLMEASPWPADPGAAEVAQPSGMTTKARATVDGGVAEGRQSPYDVTSAGASPGAGVGLLRAPSFSGPPSGAPSGFADAQPASEFEAPATLSARKAQLEREAIANALRRTKGNRVAAARLLAISRATLYEKLARWPELGRRAE